MMPSAPRQSKAVFRSALFGLAILGVAVAGPSFAQQQSVYASGYGTIDPFDPSETVSHTPKDDIRLRLRLPAPDLPPSLVTSQKPTPAKSSPLVSTPSNQAPATDLTKKEQDEDKPGFVKKSIQSVLSIFDWSEDEKPAVAKSEDQRLAESSGPIRINIHVGLSKSQTNSESRETAEAESPWVRTQSRVRRLFTLGETETHE